MMLLTGNLLWHCSAHSTHDLKHGGGCHFACAKAAAHAAQWARVFCSRTHKTSALTPPPAHTCRLVSCISCACARLWLRSLLTISRSRRSCWTAAALCVPIIGA